MSGLPPKSPAKEQPGEQNAAPQASDKPIAGRETSKDELAGYKQPGVLDSPVPAVAAPDVAAMVKRLRRLNVRKDGYVECLPGLIMEAAALIEKLAEQKCIK